MKLLLVVLAIMIVSGAASAQEKAIESCRPAADNLFARYENPQTETKTAEIIAPAAAQSEKDSSPATEKNLSAFVAPPRVRAQRFAFVKDDAETVFKAEFDAPPGIEKAQSKEVLPQNDGEEKFHWKPALIQSGIFLGIQHAARMYESKTRREFDGPFFRDWKNSVKNLRGWDDGGKVFTNYVAHPMQGAVTGRIFINNSERAKKQEFGKSKAYWASRMKALTWSAVWSTQFEIGPFSEASLGNVGLKPHADGRSRLTWGDMVITPVVGTVWVVGEDAIDKYVLRNWIEKKGNRKTSTGVKIARSFLTPTTSFSNLLRGKYPWARDFRPN